MNTTFVSRFPSVARRRAACDLVDDLGGLEVAREAQLAGRAEGTADRAAARLEMHSVCRSRWRPRAG
jgi:hypothetical protein